MANELVELIEEQRRSLLTRGSGIGLFQLDRLQVGFDGVVYRRIASTRVVVPGVRTTQGTKDGTKLSYCGVYRTSSKPRGTVARVPSMLAQVWTLVYMNLRSTLVILPNKEA